VYLSPIEFYQAADIKSNSLHFKLDSATFLRRSAALLTLALLFAACQKDDRYRNDPNTPTAVPLRLLLPAAEVSVEKYVALFTQPEVWADWRRTGLPQLKAAANNDTNGQIPRRLPYTLDEKTYNGQNVPPRVGLTSRVWWDE